MDMDRKNFINPEWDRFIDEDGNLSDSPELREFLRRRREEEDRTMMERLRDASGLPEGTVSQLYSYTVAAARLYGVISFRDLYRLIQEFSPEVPLTEEEFLAFARHMDKKGYVYLMDPDEPATEPDPPEIVTMDWDAVTEWITMEDGLYQNIREQQRECPRYVPSREEFLRYAGEDYHEETDATRAMRDFLADAFKISGKELDDLLSDITGTLEVESEDDPQSEVNSILNLFAWRAHYNGGVLVQRQEEFLKCFEELYYHTRYTYLNGHTLTEIARIREALGEETWERTDFSQFHFSVKSSAKRKVGRNAPCPCGSGKKYKKCCGRGGNE